MKRQTLTLLAILWLFLTLAGAAGTAAATEPPRLILLLVIDQARSHDLDRFRPLLRGGLLRLLERGIFFSRTYHEHAITLTAPGHATLATGLHPARHGIVANQWFDREKKEAVYCVGDPVHGRSPGLLLGSTLGDWLKKSDGQSQVYAAAGKDRSAILLGGHDADAAFWYDLLTGQFVSSSYYENNNPGWLAAFNDLKLPDRSFAVPWNPLPLDVDLAAFGIQKLNQGVYTTDFPRALGGRATIPGARYYKDYFASPAGDRYLGQLAREIVLRENLGKDDHLDLLALGFSSLDAVGHTHGPDSREALDTLLRLDLVLGELLSFLDREVGEDRVLVALSSDHGVLPLPELQTEPGGTSRRFNTQDILCRQGAANQLQKALGDGDWFLDDFYLNPATITSRKLKKDQVALLLSGIYEDCAAVRRAWTAAALMSEEPQTDPFFQLFANSFHAERSADLMLQMKPGILPFTDQGTSHGSPYPYDTHVPFLVVAPGYDSGRITDRIQTVDVAPTLAALAGLGVPPGLDGKARVDMMGTFQHLGKDTEKATSPRQPPR